jgi:hypothetical protein
MLSDSSSRRGWRLRRWALAPVIGGLLLALGAPASALAQDPRFTCRASALRIDTFGPLNPLTPQPIEPFVANDANAQCQTDEAALVDEDLPEGLGEVAVLFARTGMDDQGRSTAEAGVLDATINAPAPIGPIGVEVLTSEATASCDRATGAETFTGSSTIAAVDIAGQHIEPIPGEPQEVAVPGGLLIVHFARQTQTAEQITQQALVIEAFNPVTGEKLAEVVIAEAIADVHRCEPPPPPPPTKCNAGRGNGSEPTPSSPDCDPGGSTGRNKGGD